MREGIEREPQPNSKEREALEAIDLDDLRKELESSKFQWYFIEGAIDFLKNGKDYILRTHEDYKDDPKAHEQIMAQIAESHIMNFTPPGWVEPIRVPVGSVNYELTELVGKRISATLLQDKLKKQN